MKTDIVLAGVGGQGILSIATIIGMAALEKDMYIKQAEVHGMSQRGGDVQSNLRISDAPVASDLIPLGGADLIVSLEPMEALRYLPFLKKDGWIITNTNPFINIESYPEQEAISSELKRHGKVVAFDMDEAAKQLGSPRSSNMILLGATTPFLPLGSSEIEDGIRKLFGAKGEKIVDVNIKAFEAGRDFTTNLLNN